MVYITQPTDVSRFNRQVAGLNRRFGEGRLSGPQYDYLYKRFRLRADRGGPLHYEINPEDVRRVVSKQIDNNLFILIATQIQKRLALAVESNRMGWPEDTGESLKSFKVSRHGRHVLISNTSEYADYVERGIAWDGNKRKDGGRFLQRYLYNEFGFESELVFISHTINMQRWKNAGSPPGLQPTLRATFGEYSRGKYGDTQKRRERFRFEGRVQNQIKRLRKRAQLNGLTIKEFQRLLKLETDLAEHIERLSHPHKRLTKAQRAERRKQLERNRKEAKILEENFKKLARESVVDEMQARHAKQSEYQKFKIVARSKHEIPKEGGVDIFEDQEWFFDVWDNSGKKHRIPLTGPDAPSWARRLKLVRNPKAYFRYGRPGQGGVEYITLSDGSKVRMPAKMTEAQLWRDQLLSETHIHGLAPGSLGPDPSKVVRYVTHTWGIPDAGTPMGLLGRPRARGSYGRYEEIIYPTEPLVIPSTAKKYYDDQGILKGVKLTDPLPGEMEQYSIELNKAAKIGKAAVNAVKEKYAYLQAGITGVPTGWSYRTDDFGRVIEIWEPKGPGSLAYRKIGVTNAEGQLTDQVVMAIGTEVSFPTDLPRVDNLRDVRWDAKSGNYYDRTGKTRHVARHENLAQYRRRYAPDVSDEVFEQFLFNIGYLRRSPQYPQNFTRKQRFDVHRAAEYLASRISPRLAERGHINSYNSEGKLSFRERKSVGGGKIPASTFDATINWEEYKLLIAEGQIRIWSEQSEILDSGLPYPQASSGSDRRVGGARGSSNIARPLYRHHTASPEKIAEIREGKTRFIEDDETRRARILENYVRRYGVKLHVPKAKP